MEIKKIAAYLETIAPLALQEDYDNSGLLIGSPEKSVEKALICLDVTPDVIKEAVTENCGLVISHHPLIFQGLKRLTGSSDVEETVVEAVRNNIAVYAIHTNLDNVLQDGVNGKIAERIGMRRCEVLAPLSDGAVPGYGSGAVGELPEPMTEEAFLAHLKRVMDLKVIRHTSLTGQSVKKVAVCGGSGSFLLPRAIAVGAQFFISADFKYHDFFDIGAGIVIADIGHFESERYTMDLLADLIRRKFPNFAAQLAKTVTNPITYYSG